MAGLLDFLQSASNAAASNVSGPVDLLTLALRKLGLPVPEDTLGSSQWMERQGLTRPVQQSATSLAGETAGLLAPLAAVAKAPQIAKGLLQGADNLAAPRTLNPQTGALVWHGSPHKFDKFDASKIGTGEGAQAYGHGLYLADEPSVAATYKSAGTDAATFVPTRSIRDSAQMAATALARSGGDMRHATAILSQNAQSGDMTAGYALQLLKSGAKLPESKYAGSLYKVDLPDEHIAKMLDWDKPLSQQAPGVQAALQSPEVLAMVEGLKKKGLLGDYTHADLAKFKGEDWHDFIRQAASDSNVAPSEVLRAKGIPGIRYLDGGSRAGGAGTSNYVVFPGNEHLLNILERNGIPIR